MIADISQFESLQNSSPQMQFVANWGNRAAKKWLEWAWNNPKLLAYAQRLARSSAQSGFFGKLDVAPTELQTNDPYLSAKRFYGKNPDYKGYRDALYNKDFLKKQFNGDRKQEQEYYTNMAKQELSYYLETAKLNDKNTGNLWSTMVKRLHDNSLLTARELAYLGKNLNEVSSIIPWIQYTIRHTGQFRGTKFAQSDLQPRRWND